MGKQQANCTAGCSDIDTAYLAGKGWAEGAHSRLGLEVHARGEQSTRSSQCLLICCLPGAPGRECCLFSYPCVAFTCVSHTLAFPGLR